MRWLLVSLTLSLGASAFACAQVAGLKDFVAEGGGGAGATGGGGAGGRTCMPTVGDSWSSVFAGVESQTVRTVAVDPCSGDVVVAGVMDGGFAVQPDGESLEAFGGINDMFFARFTVEGELRFARSFGPLDDTETVQPNGVAVDRDGNMVVVGSYRGTMDFGNGSVASPMAQNDAFVVSYSPGGDFLWLQTFGGDVQDVANAVAIDPADGSIWVTGSYRPGASFFGETPGGSGDDAFVLRMTAEGTKPAEGEFFWQLGGASTQVGQSIQVDDERFYVAGNFPAEIDPIQAPVVTGDVGFNVFVAAYEKSGAIVWIEPLAGAGDAVEPQLALAFDSVMLSANVVDSVASICGSHTAPTGAIVVMGFNPDGSCVGAMSVQIGGGGLDLARALAVNRDGELFMAGTYDDDMVTPELVVEDGVDMFVIQLAAGGTPLNAERVDSNGPGDELLGMAFGPSGERVLAGRFNNQIFEAGTSFTTVEGNDGFVVRTLP